MDKYLYTCDYCAKTYVPKRRYKQRFCSNSCRVNSHKRKNKLSPAKPDAGLKAPTEKPHKEGISMAGIGNATIANIVTEVGKSLLIKEEDKPVTKAEFQRLADKLGQRYILIKNMNARADGAPAYFDTKLQEIVHLKFLPPWK